MKETKKRKRFFTSVPFKRVVPVKTIFSCFSYLLQKYISMCYLFSLKVSSSGQNVSVQVLMCVDYTDVLN